MTVNQGEWIHIKSKNLPSSNDQREKNQMSSLGPLSLGPSACIGLTEHREKALRTQGCSVLE